MGAWVIGQNLPGYLPQDDDPAAFTEWNDAAEYYRSFVEEWADESDERHFESCDCESENDPQHEECYGSDRAFVGAVLHDDPLRPDQDYGMIFTANDGSDICLWLQWSDDAEAEVTS